LATLFGKPLNFFYTIWWTGTGRENFVAVAHCTGGDLLMTTITLLVASLVARLRGWRPFGRRMIVTAIALGIGSTILSEWVNVDVWRSWSYTSAMPVLPWLGTGVSPLLQWLVVPTLAFAISGLRNRSVVIPHRRGPDCGWRRC
jgi:hypothetical protein